MNLGAMNQVTTMMAVLEGHGEKHRLRVPYSLVPADVLIYRDVYWVHCRTATEHGAIRHYYRPAKLETIT